MSPNDPFSEAPQWTDEQRAKIRNWMKSKWTYRECRQCSHEKWVIGDAPARLPLGYPNTADQYFGGLMYSLVVITCSNCGNTLFINSVVAGIESRRGGGNGS